MYMPGRLRTPSRPLRTPMELASYPSELGAVVVGSAIETGPVWYHARGGSGSVQNPDLPKNLARLDAVIRSLSMQQDVAAVRGGDEALSSERREVLKQE